MSAPVRREESHPRYLALAIASLLFLGTLAIYASARNQGFLPLDDIEYVKENPHVLRGLTADGVGWAFTHFHAANWHPLTWLSHMLDCQLWGPSAAASHVVNVVIHATSAVLLFLVMQWMTGALWRSALVAALFAWHPLHIQSVAWIAERKDVLSGLFMMLTIAAYLWYVRRPGWGRLSAVVLCHALGLMAKPMLVSVPFVLLFLDFWPLGRLRSMSASRGVRGLMPIMEKLPLIALSAASCVITVMAQRSGGAIVPIDYLPLPARLANAAISYVLYLGKAIWPASLSIIYPYDHDIPEWQVTGAVVLLLVISVATVMFARRAPFLAVGWFWYVVMLGPVIGIVQVGGQAMADRYTYLPLIGVFVAAVWGIALVLEQRIGLRWIGAVCGSAIVGVMIVDTLHELRYWATNTALFARAVEVTDGGAGPHTCLGIALSDEGRSEEAVKEYEAALALTPNNSGVHFSLANALHSLQRFDQAIEHYETAIRINPRDARVYNNLGSALLKQGRFDDAMARYQESVGLDPDQPEAQFNLAGCLLNKSDRKGALEHFERAIYLRPNYAEAHNNLGSMLIVQGKVKEATDHFNTALRIRPDYINAHVNLANALAASPSADGAVAHYQEALRLNPVYVPTLRDFASFRASHVNAAYRNAKDAVRMAKAAATISEGKDPVVLDVLASAFAEAGQFDDAIATATKAQEIALAKKQPKLAGKIGERLELYRAGKPYRKSE